MHIVKDWRVRKSGFAVLVMLGCAALAAGADQDPWGRETVMPIVRDGKALVSIVIAAEARPAERNAAQALRDTIQQMTGVALELREVAAGAPLPPDSIVVGDAALARRAGVAVAAAKLSYDGFHIQARDGRLVLSGVPERGPLYAVVDFLEREAGCRWFSGTREIIPKRPTLVVSVKNRYESPAMQVRMPCGIDIWQPASRVTDTTTNWGADPLSSEGNVHTFYCMDVPPERFFAEHPEWYSFHRGGTNGVRFHQHGQLNYHNAELAAYVAGERIKAFRTWAKDKPCMNVSQNDCFGWSEDPVTVAFDAAEGSVAASHVYFVNQVADLVARELPERRLLTLAYLQSSVPPRTLSYASNVTLRICEPDGIWGRAVTRTGPLGQQYLDRIRVWSGKTTLPIVWIYHRPITWRYQFNPDVDGLPGDFRAYRDAGAKGFFAEIYSDRSNFTHFDDLRSYLMPKLAWNPDLDFAELLRDFHLHYFGPKSGPTMLEFYHATVDGLDDFGPEAWSSDRLARMEEILARALPLADDAYARRRILEGQRAVVYTRLLKRVGEVNLRDGIMRNGADAPECVAWRERFNALQTELGSTEMLAAAEQQFRQEVLAIANAELKLTIAPQSGGAVIGMLDLRTKDEAAYVSTPYGGGGLVGGYQELYGFVWGAPGVATPFVVRERAADSVTLGADTLPGGMAVTRTVRLTADRPGFSVRTQVSNTGTGTLTRGVRTHPMFRNGDMADNYFVYRTGAGVFKVQPLPVLEAMSADSGPTGLWAAMNVRSNRGILWESPPGHNGCYVWASSSQGGYFCVETFTEHGVLKPGGTLEINQTFTLLRDAKGWCAQRGVELPFAK